MNTYEYKCRILGDFSRQGIEETCLKNRPKNVGRANSTVYS